MYESVHLFNSWEIYFKNWNDFDGYIKVQSYLFLIEYDLLLL